MTYGEIIKRNLELSPVTWWPNYAYHYTDVRNAIGILQSSKLYSRIKAQAKMVMKNDNASRQVIDMTMSDATSFVRFYFRPLTPTQYYNEGYKHPQLRYDGDINANISVPVFFTFRLEKLLLNSKTCFSNLSQAGYGSSCWSGEYAFENLEFKKIYSYGFTDDETRKYRHAEILYPYEYDIDESLEFILCRNKIERETLLNLLYDTDLKAFYKYKDKIKVCRRDMFEKNGLYLDDILFNFETLTIVFADSYDKKTYDTKQIERLKLQNLRRIPIIISIDWKSGKEKCFAMHLESEIDYIKPSPITLKNLPHVPKAKTLSIKITIEGKLIAYKIFNLEQMQII